MDLCKFMQITSQYVTPVVTFLKENMFGEYCIKDKTYTAVKCINADIADGTLPKWTLMNDANDDNAQPIDFRKIRPLGFMARARALHADSAQKNAFDEEFTFELFFPQPYGWRVLHPKSLAIYR